MAEFELFAQAVFMWTTFGRSKFLFGQFSNSSQYFKILIALELLAGQQGSVIGKYDNTAYLNLQLVAEY